MMERVLAAEDDVASLPLVGRGLAPSFLRSAVREEGGLEIYDALKNGVHFADLRKMIPS